MVLCKFYVIFLTFILANSILVGPLRAQSVPGEKGVPQVLGTKSNSKSTFMDEAHRKRIYDERKLSQSAAIGYSLLLPGLGNMYAEQYFVGVLFMSAMAFAAFFATYAFSTDQPEFYVGASLLAGGAYITSSITAALAVQDFNNDLRRALKVSLGLKRKDMAGISLKITF